MSFLYPCDAYRTVPYRTDERGGHGGLTGPNVGGLTWTRYHKFLGVGHEKKSVVGDFVRGPLRSLECDSSYTFSLESL